MINRVFFDGLPGLSAQASDLRPQGSTRFDGSVTSICAVTSLLAAGGMWLVGGHLSLACERSNELSVIERRHMSPPVRFHGAAYDFSPCSACPS